MNYEDKLGDLVASTTSPDITDETANAPSLDDLRRMYREAYDVTSQSRDLANRDRDYFDGYAQLNPAVRAKLRKRKQPETYWNKIKPAINGTLGVLDSSQTDPQAKGRNDDDDAAADIVTEVLRYLADKNDLAALELNASRNFVIEGIGASIIELGNDDEPRITHVPFDEFFYDPCSRRYDFDDAAYMGRARWMDGSRALRKWPDAFKRIGLPSGSNDYWTGSGPEDKPNQMQLWIDRSRERVLIVELYHQDGHSGEWRQTLFCHSGIISHSPVYFKDDLGMSFCPINAACFEIDRQNQRYGMVRDMVPLQDSINARHSKMLHLTTSTKVQVTDAAVAQPAQARRAQEEAQKADGLIPAGYGLIHNEAEFQGNLAILNNDVAAIERMAPTPALLGRIGGANESGKARQILQQAGLTELARAFSVYEGWQKLNYKKLWWVASVYMDAPKVIRVTGDGDASQKLQINQPIYQTVMAPIVDPQTGQPAIGPDSRPVLQPQQHQVGMIHGLAQMDMDITITTVRQSDSYREQALAALSTTIAQSGLSPLDPGVEFLIEMSLLPNKDWLLNRWRAIRDAAQQGQAQQQAVQQQQAQQQAAIQASAMEARSAKDAAAAHRDQSLAEKHQMEVQGMALDVAYKHALLQTGQNPGVIGPNG